MFRAYVLTFLLLTPGAAIAAPCSEALKDAKALATTADAKRDAAIKADVPGAELRAAQAWHTAQTRTGRATDALAGIDRSTCNANQKAEIGKLTVRLSQDWHAAEAKFQENRAPACEKLVADARAEAQEMTELEAVAEPQVYAETGMGHEYKMIWRVSLAKGFACRETRELFDMGRAMSREIEAYLGTPKPETCSATRKIAAERAAADDPVGFITYVHVALHYAGCDSQELITTDDSFRELYEKYHQLAPQVYGNVYE